jgi:hypothetical protein
MGWPTPQEYNEAIQNPLSAFEDPELRAGQPLLTPLGLPRPITGAFASVYQRACANGRTVAVRCFLRDFGDHQERYAAISAHLARVRLPYMTNFTYLANGIRVNGRWYPVLKMDWLEGEALQTYVARNLHNPDALRDLAAQWVTMAKELRTAWIGHGDLQHGNVIVSGDKLRLIDYDGMFVPALAGRQSHEIGHRNYQHPRRSERDFGPNVDHFSFWVVYTSLVALSVQPQLWQDYSGGDECLIFRREDFERPAASRLLRTLENAPDTRLADLADIFHAVILHPPSQVPPVDGPLGWSANGSGPKPAAPSAPAASSAPAADWLRDHLGQPPPAPAGSSAAGPASATKAAPPAAGLSAAAIGKAQPGANGAGSANGAITANGAAGAASGAASAAAEAPSWIRDFIGAQQVAAVEFRGSLAEQRQALRTPVMLAVLTWIGFTWFGLSVSVPAAVTAVAAVIALGALANGYRQDPSVQAQWGEQVRLREVETQTRTAQRRLQVIQRKLNRAEQKLEKRRARLEASRQQSKDGEQADLAKHDARLQTELAAAQQRRDEVIQSGAERVRKLEAKHAAELAALDKEIAGLHQETDDALRRALLDRQQQFVQSYMKRQTIDAAVIAGIGPNVKDSLRKHGIVRAMDIDPQRLAQVEGIGEARLRVLLEWRRKAEHLAAQTAPQNLSLLDETLIRGRFLKRRLELEQDKGKLQGKLAREVAEAQQHTAEQLKAADEKPQKLRAAAAQKRDEIRQRFQQARKQVLADLAELDKQAAATQGALDSEADAVQQELAMLNAQRAAIAASLRRYEGLQFSAYVRRVVTGE